MRLKVILLMIVMLASVFSAIYVSTIYAGFAAPYLIGMATPIVINEIYNFNINFKGISLKKSNRK